ncbi:MAG: enoyl-CoA hydratase/isomerase family protein, partial [Acidiferrobacterales bacterium]
MIETKECAGIGVLRMKHGKANALDTELCTELKTALQQQHAKAVVLTGEGKIFSAGVDLVRLLKDGEDYRRSLLRALSEALHTLFFYPRPVIAAINGHAIAGGCIVACAADHRIMTHEAGRIGIPELLVGVPFPPMALEVMRFNVPAHHLQQLIFRGLTCVPEHALTWGLVDELVEGERLLERALERATELAAIP